MYLLQVIPHKQPQPFVVTRERTSLKICTSALSTHNTRFPCVPCSSEESTAKQHQLCRAALLSFVCSSQLWVSQLFKKIEVLKTALESGRARSGECLSWPPALCHGRLHPEPAPQPAAARLGTLGVLLHSSSFILQTVFRAVIDTSLVVPYEMYLTPMKNSSL